MDTSSLLMGLVAAICAVGGTVVLLRRTTSEASVYRNRIAGTMLAAGAAILAIFAFALHALQSAGGA